jgi:hypothetical protein
MEGRLVVLVVDEPEADLLTVDDLNRVLTTRNMHHPGVGLITAERKIAAEDFAYPSGLVDTARLYRHFADGATISLNGVFFSLSASREAEAAANATRFAMQSAVLRARAREERGKRATTAAQ